MVRIVRLTESDLVRLVRKVINEENSSEPLIVVDSNSYPIIKTLYDNKQTTGTWSRTKYEDGLTIVPNGQSKTYHIEGPSSDFQRLPSRGSFNIKMNYMESGRSFGGYSLEIYQ